MLRSHGVLASTSSCLWNYFHCHLRCAKYSTRAWSFLLPSNPIFPAQITLVPARVAKMQTIEVVTFAENDTPGNSVALDVSDMPGDLIVAHNDENPAPKQTSLDGIDNEAINISSEAPQTTPTAEEQTPSEERDASATPGQPSSETRDIPATAAEQPASKEDATAAQEEQPPPEKKDAPVVVKEPSCENKGSPASNGELSSSEEKKNCSVTEKQPSSEDKDTTASPDQPSPKKTDAPNTPKDLSTKKKDAAGTEEKPSSKKEGPADSKEPSTETNDDSLNPEDTPEWKEWAKARTKIPLKAAVKWSNFEQFKNRFSPEEGLEIIEVLYGHPGLATEIAREKIRRDSRRVIASRVDPGDESRWMQRVRIQSPILMHFLSRFASTESTTLTWPVERPRVFFRPFTLFYHTLPHMKRCLQMLQSTQAGEEIYAHQYPQNLDPYDLKSPILTRKPTFSTKEAEKEKVTEGTVGAIDMPPNPDLWDAVLGVPDPANALQHVLKYVEFIEKHIVPMWDEAVAPTKTRARFYDIPMIFRPGDLLFVPKSSDKSVDKNKPGAMQVRQEIFKLSHVEPANTMIDGGPNDFRATGMEMHVMVYHIDFDGST